jgi:FtsH-binding integral membrane protein
MVGKAMLIASWLLMTVGVALFLVALLVQDITPSDIWIGLVVFAAGLAMALTQARRMGREDRMNAMIGGLTLTIALVVILGVSAAVLTYLLARGAS